MPKRRDDRRWAGLRGTLLGAVGVTAFLLLALRTVPTSSRLPWDFATYWYAGLAATQGVSPYDPQALSRLANWPVGMPFLYPPITLPIMIPLTLLPIELASYVWLGVKILLLLALVLLWHRCFLHDSSVLLVAGVAVLGFNAATLWDLREGNVAIIEQLLLWAGLAAFLNGRRRLFVLCVVCASIFKLTPIAFLGLLLIPSRDRRPDWKLAGGALALLACLVFLPALAGPAWARGFLHNLPRERPWGLVNPSALSFIDMLLGDHTTPLTAPPFKALFLLLAYEGLVLGLSIPTIRRLWRQRNPRELLLAAAMLYALLLPRLMVYSYLWVIVPALALASPIVSRYGGRYLIAGIVSAQALAGTLLRTSYLNLWIANLSFFTLLGLWLIYLAWGARHAEAFAVRGMGEPSRRTRARSS